MVPSSELPLAVKGNSEALGGQDNGILITSLPPTSLDASMRNLYSPAVRPVQCVEFTSIDKVWLPGPLVAEVNPSKGCSALRPTRRHH